MSTRARPHNLNRAQHREQLWKSQLSGDYSNGLGQSYALGDNSGGLLLGDPLNGYLLDINARSGQTTWDYSAPCEGLGFDVAVGTTGTISVV